MFAPGLCGLPGTSPGWDEMFVGLRSDYDGRKFLLTTSNVSDFVGMRFSHGFFL